MKKILVTLCLLCCVSAIYGQRVLSPNYFYNIMDLARGVGVSNTVVQVYGPQGGSFRWVDTSTAADDYGVTFRVAGVSPGAWVREFTGNVNAAWFGLTDDYVSTASQGINDRVAMQRAINFCTKNFRKLYTLEVPTGTYVLDSIYCPIFTTIVGQGWITENSGRAGTRFYWPLGSNNDMFIFSGIPGSTGRVFTQGGISDCEISIQDTSIKPTIGAHGIALRGIDGLSTTAGQDRFFIHDMMIRGAPGAGMFFSNGMAPSYIWNSKVWFCGWVDSTFGGIYVTGGVQMGKFDNISFDGNMGGQFKFYGLDQNANIVCNGTKSEQRANPYIAGKPTGGRHVFVIDSCNKSTFLFDGVAVNSSTYNQLDSNYREYPGDVIFIRELSPTREPEEVSWSGVTSRLLEGDIGHIGDTPHIISGTVINWDQHSGDYPNRFQKLGEKNMFLMGSGKPYPGPYYNEGGGVYLESASPVFAMEEATGVYGGLAGRNKLQFGINANEVYIGGIDTNNALVRHLYIQRATDGQASKFVWTGTTHELHSIMPRWILVHDSSASGRQRFVIGSTGQTNGYIGMGFLGDGSISATETGKKMTFYRRGYAVNGGIETKQPIYFTDTSGTAWNEVPRVGTDSIINVAYGNKFKLTSTTGVLQRIDSSIIASGHFVDIWFINNTLIRQKNPAFTATNYILMPDSLSWTAQAGYIYRFEKRDSGWMPSGLYKAAASGGVTSFASRTGAVTPQSGDYSSITETLTNKTINGSNNTITNVSLTTGVTGVLPIANGGNNSSAALNNNRVMRSSGGAIVEAAAITAGRVLISDANGIPIHSTVTTAQLQDSVPLYVKNIGATAGGDSLLYLHNDTLKASRVRGVSGRTTWTRESDSSLTVDISSSYVGQNTITTLGTITTGTIGSGAVIARPTMTLGSDATGDIYYRNASGILTRLGVGSDGQVLTLASGLPSWAAGASGITSINSLTGSSQTIGISVTGTAPSVGSSGTTHTIGIPEAGASATHGLISNTGQVIAGAKEFTGVTNLSGTFSSNSTLANGNAFVTASSGIGNTTGATNLQILGSSTNHFGAGFNPTITKTGTANAGLFNVGIAGNTYIEASSGTHGVNGVLAVKGGTLTNGSATTTVSSTVIIDGPMSGTATVTEGFGSLYVTSGNIRFGRSGATTNFTLGNYSVPASANNSFTIFNGTAPSASVTDGVTLYAEDVSSSSELKVRDEAGNVTTLSPHNFSGIPGGKSEDMAWAFYSERDGKYVNVDMLKLARLIEQLTGEKLVYTGNVNNKPAPIKRSAQKVVTKKR